MYRRKSVAIISNIKQITHFIITGNLTGRRIEIQPHIKRLSTILPIHKSAFEALNTPSIVGFLKEKTDGELQKIRNWENIHLSLAKPFLDVNLEPRSVSVQQNGKPVIIRVLADKNVTLTTEEDLPLVFNGIEYPFHLAKTIETQGTVPITPPPVTVPGPQYELKGRPASYYIGIGTAYVPTRPDISKFPSENIKPEEIENEVNAAGRAFSVIANKYRIVAETDKQGEKKEIADIILMVLDDTFEHVRKLIEDEKMNLKMALDKFLGGKIQEKKSSTVEKFRNIGEELEQTVQNLILAKHNELPDLLADVRKIHGQYKGEKVVLVCNKIDFVDAALLDPDLIDGVVEEKGGIKSHTQIACKSNGIALVIGVDGATSKIKTGDRLIEDGERGVVLVNPTKKSLEKFQQIKEESVKDRAHLREKYRKKTAKTLDGIEISICGNSKSIAETERLQHEGIDNIGLFRTEELMDVGLFNGTIVKRTKQPSLTEQVEFYAHIFTASGTKKPHVIIRTMDVNGDKYIIYLGKPQRSDLCGPMEGVGICLDQQNHKPYYDLFKDQIKAILIAAKRAGIEPIVEFPMVTSVKQFEEAKSVVEKAKKEMTEDKIDFESKVKYYAMVEHPNIIREIDELAKVADGLSLGTNDLTMKTLFEDRYSASTQFNELDPNVISAVVKTINSVKSANKPLLVCGDMASDPISVPVLLGLGIREFSVDASSANVIKSMVSNIDIKACERLVNELKEIKSAEEARRYVAEFIMTRMNHGDEEHGDWKGLKELESILKKYTFLADGTDYKTQK